MNPTAGPVPPSDCEIFRRVIETRAQGLTPELAEHILDLGFSPQDQARVDELVAISQSGYLSESEQSELDSFLHVESLLAVWKSRARRIVDRPLSL